MASAINPPFQCNSSEHPPTMKNSFSCLEKELVELFKKDYLQIQQHMTRLSGILKTYEESSTLAAIGSKHGINSGIAGGVMMGLGILFASLTLGVVLCAAGAAVAACGLSGSRVWKSKQSSMEAAFRGDFKAELMGFQIKIFCLTGKTKDIDQLIKEILRDINNPKHEVSYLAKYFASACEFSRFIRIYDVGGLAARISETVNLSGTITGIVVQVESTKEFRDMRNKIIQLQTLMNAFENIRIILT